MRRLLMALVLVLTMAGWGWCDWRPHKSNLGLNLNLGSSGRDEALYSGTNWTYNYTTGIWTNNPTLEADINTNPDFSNGTLWTADAGWAVAGGVATRSVAAASYVSANVNACTANRHYKLVCDINVTEGNGFKVQVGGNSHANYETGNKTITHIIRSISTATARVYGGATAAGTADNFHCYPMTFSTLIVSRTFGQQVGISAQASIPEYYSAGVFTRYSDANNFLLAYYDYSDGKAYLLKKIAGTYTQLLGVAVAYTQWKAVEIRFSAANTAQLYYGGVQQGADQDVSTVPAGNIAGLFSTGSTCQLRTITHSP